MLLSSKPLTNRYPNRPNTSPLAPTWVAGLPTSHTPKPPSKMITRQTHGKRSLLRMTARHPSAKRPTALDWDVQEAAVQEGTQRNARQPAGGAGNQAVGVQRVVYEAVQHLHNHYQPDESNKQVEA